MLNAFKQKHHNDANASVVDGKLILSFPEALTPIVWQMDLSDAKSSSFEVVEEGKNFALVTKKQGAQKKESIAPFSTKEQAIAALMATSSALKNGHGHIAAPSSAAAHSAQPHAQTVYHMPPQAAQQKGSAGKWAVAILCLLVIGFLFTSIANMQPRIAGGGDGASRTSASAGAGANAASSAGVAVSADDFLRSR